jgi:enoyl-CoA hydratase/carnithine racemase
MTLHTVESDLLAAGGLRLELDGALATVVLARPERRNAMSNATFTAVGAVPALLPSQTRVVLIRAEGAMFCAGLDLRLTTPEGIPGEKSLADITAGGAEFVEEWIAGIQQAFAWLHDPALITVAAVHGAAIGGGFQLALHADIRVVATDARFSMREVALGIVPDLGGTQNLSALVGYSRALDICATGRWVEAEEALAIGLANVVVAPDQLLERAAQLCASVVANPPAAVRGVKGLLLGADQREPAAQSALERRTQVPLLRGLTAGGATPG